jgi:hypothetical protein
MKVRRSWLLLILAAAGSMVWAMTAGTSVARATGAGGPAAATGALVSTSGPTGQFPRNMQNMPAVAVDPVDPSIVAASGNDLIDMQPCSKKAAITAAACSLPVGTGLGGHFNLGVGMSAAYFSFDSGHRWTQPTYAGLTAAHCNPAVEPCKSARGVIHTVPNYAKNGLRTRGNATVAFGPVPKNGKFSYANGTRLYYSTLATNLTDTAIRPGRIDSTFTITASHLDNPTPARVATQSNWSNPVIVPRRESAISFPLEAQVWADNASSSPRFGNVYMCYDNFIVPTTGNLLPVVPTVAVSTNGGQSWTTHQVAPATDSTAGGYRLGCSVRTDSHGVVYAFFTHYPGLFPSQGVVGAQTMVKSSDGGAKWTRPDDFIQVNTGCFYMDPIFFRCSMEGPAGTRSDFQPAPSVDIANGAPTGAHATNEMVLSWSDGRFGPNNDATLLSYSGNHGQSWSAPATVSLPGDRSLYSAAAIAPDGSRVYVTYSAFTTPFSITTSTPRLERGVLRSAAIAPDGAPTGWTTDFVGATGDVRGTTPADNNYSEYLGNYISVAAARSYGVGVWTGVSHAADCPAIDAWRQASFNVDNPVFPAPWPQARCPAKFGNSDIFSATNAP